MAISAITPAADSVLAPGDALSFTVDNTYTSMVIECELSSGWEYAYDSSLGGAQSGFSVTVTDNGDGTHTFSFARTAGWNLNPFQVKVIEDESGSPVTTTTSYYLSSEVSFPNGSDPYYGTYQGNFTVTDAGVLVRSDVKWINIAGSGYTLSDDGNGKVTLTLSAGGGGGTWGSITGTLSAQTDLQAALDAKKPVEISGAGAPGVSTGNGKALGTVYVDTTGDRAYTLVDATTDSNVWDSGVADHGALTGLGDDDHTQYVLAAGTRLQDAAYFTERAAHLNTPAAGKAEFWVKNDAPCTPMFTDDAAEDFYVATISTIPPATYALAYADGAGKPDLEFSAFFKADPVGGDIVLTSAGGGVRIAEGATGPTLGAGYGGYWVKDDTPTNPVFTDDTSVDRLVITKNNATASTTNNGIPKFNSIGQLQDVNTLTYSTGELKNASGTGSFSQAERASGPTASAGYSYLWTKNDTPSSLYHRDDAGNDHKLESHTIAAGIWNYNGTGVVATSTKFTSPSSTTKASVTSIAIHGTPNKGASGSLNILDRIEQGDIIYIQRVGNPEGDSALYEVTGVTHSTYNTYTITYLGEAGSATFVTGADYVVSIEKSGRPAWYNDTNTSSSTTSTTYTFAPNAVIQVPAGNYFATYSISVSHGTTAVQSAFRFVYWNASFVATAMTDGEALWDSETINRSVIIGMSGIITVPTDNFYAGLQWKTASGTLSSTNARFQIIRIA